MPRFVTPAGGARDHALIGFAGRPVIDLGVDV
jgi:acetyl-CoA carboxylase beta subunit